jgi:hypothetical protein
MTDKVSVPYNRPVTFPLMARRLKHAMILKYGPRALWHVNNEAVWKTSRHQQEEISYLPDPQIFGKKN